VNIFRCFVHWYVWWGRNAFYYYSRPVVWAWRTFPCCVMWKHEQAVAECNEAWVEAKVGYEAALRRHHEVEQLQGARIAMSIDIKIAQQNLLDARRAVS